MIKYLLRFSLLILILSTSCEKTDFHMSIDPNNKIRFSGTFKTIDSDNLTGTVSLSINNGYYDCHTNLPFGYGAGKLEVDKSTMNFIDTLFFIVPAIYGPSFVPSGKYNYHFDGENLVIWNKKNIGEINYELKIININ